MKHLLLNKELKKASKSVKRGRDYINIRTSLGRYMRFQSSDCALNGKGTQYQYYLPASLVAD